MESHVTYFVSYSCPRCKAELESQHGTWQGWLRCPTCGFPSLPPELLFGHPMTRRRVLGRDEDEAIPTEDMPLAPGALDRSPTIVPAPSAPFGVMRMIFLGGLVVSLFLLLIFYLDENPQFTGVFGATAIIFFVLLVRAPSRRSRYGD